MKSPYQHLDPGSWVTMVLTVVLFVVALFVKGWGHDLLLEAGVFLVSAKLMIMAYKNGAAASRLEERLDRFESALARIEQHVTARVEH